MRVGCDGPGCDVVERDDEAVGWLRIEPWGTPVYEVGVYEPDGHFHSVKCALAFLTEWEKSRS